MQEWERFIRGMRLAPEAAQQEGYPYDLPVLRRFQPVEFHSQIVFLAGENGTGKSTLLEAIAVASGLNPEGGSRDMRFSSRDTHSDLYQHVILTKGVRRPSDSYFLRAESFYNLASEVDDLEQVGPPGFLANYGGRSLHQQSHGESFLALVQNRFRGHGLYLLDEPEAALSPMRQMTLMAEIHQLAREGSQFFIATHSPILMSCPDSTLYWLEDGRMEVRDYRQTPHYFITRQFMENPQRMLGVLLEEENP
ncbi:MAG: AAA family ATPase [Eubacteriales bacterium]|jgi:predicted ATPase